MKSVVVIAKSVTESGLQFLVPSVRMFFYEECNCWNRLSASIHRVRHRSLGLWTLVSGFYRLFELLTFGMSGEKKLKPS